MTLLLIALETQGSSGIRLAVQVLQYTRLGEDEVARALELPAQMVQVDVEQLPLPLAHLARDDHGLDVAAVHQGDDRSRHVVERRNVDRLGVEDDDVGLLARGERAGPAVKSQVLRTIDRGI